MHKENTIIKSNDIYSNDILEKIFLELASSTRCAILLKLSNSPMRLSSIARELNISVQDAHRNMIRLVNAGIVVKNPDSKFTLTEYGRLIVNELSYFSFLSNLRTLMGRYTFSYLPRRFMNRLNELTNSKIVKGVSSVLEKLKMLESNARERLNIIAAQAWYDEGNIILDLVEKGVDIRIILTGRTLFPKEIFESDIVKRIHYHDKKGNIKSRFIDHTAIALYMSDTQAGIIPLTHDMNFDMNVLLISDDESFYTFCSDIFNYYWHRSSILDTNKINVIE